MSLTKSRAEGAWEEQEEDGSQCNEMEKGEGYFQYLSYCDDWFKYTAHCTSTKTVYHEIPPPLVRSYWLLMAAGGEEGDQFSSRNVPQVGCPHSGG